MPGNYYRAHELRLPVDGVTEGERSFDAFKKGLDEILAGVTARSGTIALHFTVEALRPAQGAAEAGSTETRQYFIEEVPKDR